MNYDNIMALNLKTNIYHKEKLFANIEDVFKKIIIKKPNNLDYQYILDYLLAEKI